MRKTLSFSAEISGRKDAKPGSRFYARNKVVLTADCIFFIWCVWCIYCIYETSSDNLGMHILRMVHMVHMVRILHMLHIFILLAGQ